MIHKSRVYDQCILTVMLYGAENWILTKGNVEKLRGTQRQMEKAMIGVTWRDRYKNERIKLLTVTDTSIRAAR